MKNDPAFPISKEIAESNPVAQGGLTKRELFAAMAMQAHLTGLTAAEHPALMDESKVATFSELWVAYADMLIAELEKQK